MKKNKILFNFIYILFICIIFFSCDKVLAAKELVCIYNVKSYDHGTMVVQDKEGNITIWQNDKKVTDINNKWWTINDELKIEYSTKYYIGQNLVECPQYIRYPGSSNSKIILKDSDDFGNIDHELYDGTKSLDDLKLENYYAKFGQDRSFKKTLKTINDWDYECQYSFSADGTTIFDDFRVNLIFNTNQYVLQVGPTFKSYVEGYWDSYEASVNFSRSGFDSSCPDQLFALYTTYTTYTELTHRDKLYLETLNFYLEKQGDNEKELIFKKYEENKNPIYGDKPVTIEPPQFDECQSLLGYPNDPKAPAWYLVKVFDVLKYVAILLLIVLSVLDFTAATAAQNEDKMKKATSKVIKRVLLCVLIFLLPTLIEFILKYVADRAVTLCGIK